MSLVTNPRIWQLLQDAQEYPEWATTRLWEYIQPRRFHRRLVGRVVAAAGDLTRVDLVVEWVNSSTGTANILLFVEAKRASTVTSEFCYKVERQVFLAANAYIVATGAPHIWAMTCFGGSVRLWVFIWGRTYLVPFAPNTSKHDIVNGLEYIKNHMTPPAAAATTTAVAIIPRFHFNPVRYNFFLVT
ncbi:hypothetical protein B0T24DRAFT_709335 [Lasiosphaeria ovina]|uniref:Uncharacterized protein n=1 Tax=Lasiosphaeria ovina TaxID=92902 RepID=A0AAE0N2E0_9PEZI|nr:hypothetical protein B0T24DRAFT_709335 [Lasiosphaeria ovina]